MLDVTVVFPAFNEAPNLAEVTEEIAGVLEAAGRKFEVVVVDDGSTDGSRGVLAELAEQRPWLRSLRLRRRSGKSAALAAGLRSVDSHFVVLMDADGQDDAAAVPRLLAALETDALDLVTGRRSVRRDRFVKRTTSRLFNFATAKVTGVPGRDFNSGLKVMRVDVARSLDLYGELHRYIPVLAAWQGFRVGEVDVDHRPRHAGRSKFGGNRFWRGLLDLVTVKFLTTYDARPMHLFGALGMLFGAGGSAILAWLLVERVRGLRIGDRPALIAGVLLVVVGVQLVSLGLIGELILSQSRRSRQDLAVLLVDDDGSVLAGEAEDRQAPGGTVAPADPPHLGSEDPAQRAPDG